MDSFLKIPVLMFPRGGPILSQVKNSKITSIWVRFALMTSTKILCQGPAWRKFSINTIKFSETNAPIIYNWTATESLIEIGRKKLSLQTKQPAKLLFLGWVEEMKGIFELLDVCLDISHKYKFELSIVGGGSCLGKAKDFVICNGLEEQIKFYGWLDETKTKKILSQSNILVQPSWEEGFPNSIIEAMATGIAVISTSVGNIPDILKNNTNAILIPKNDPLVLRESIVKLIENYNYRKQISKNGFEFAVQNFSTEKAVLNLENIINEVTS